MADKQIIKGLDDLEKMLEFQRGLWYSPYVKIYSIGGANRIAEISNYPRAYKDTTPHVRTMDFPYVVGVEDLPYPVKRLFKTYPNLSPNTKGVTTQGVCNGCSMCTELWSEVRNTRSIPAEIQAGTDAIIKRTSDNIARWGLSWLIPAECGWNLYLDGELVVPVVAETNLSPEDYIPINEQFYTDSRGNKYHVGEIAILYAGDPAPGAFPLWIESEELPFTPDLKEHIFSIDKIPGPIKNLTEAQQKITDTFVKLPEETTASIKHKLSTGKITLERKLADSDRQIIRIKYQRVF